MVISEFHNFCIACGNKVQKNQKATKGKTRSLHDGYFIKDNYIHFYTDSVLDKIASDKDYMVDEEKVYYYESICENYHRNFMEVGWLRLHTPFAEYQERLGTNFLYVPPNERQRIMSITGGGALAANHNLQSFYIFAKELHITMQELIGTSKLVDIFKIYEFNKEKGINEKELQKQQDFILHTKFFISNLQITGMIVQK